MTGDDRPPFAEPWHAQIYAIAHLLIETGEVSAADWSQSLGQVRAEQAAQGVADDDEGYYYAMVVAVEQHLQRLGVANQEIAVRAEDWRQAYLRTPHGKPVALDP